MNLIKLVRNIPYIDTQQLFNKTISANQFIEVLHQYGFIYLYNFEFEDLAISSKIFKDLPNYAQKFFNLSFEDKMKYYIGNSPNHRGYVPVTEQGKYADEKKRIYEAFDISYPLHHASPQDYKKLRGDNVWPQEVENFKEFFSQYYKQMFLLGKNLLDIFAEGFNLPKHYFHDFIKHPPAQLRLLNYLANDNLKEDVAMGGHTDYECFTLLYQTAPGIEAHLPNENHFVRLPVFQNSLLLIVGDMLHFMTNGYLKSLYHRVINNGTKRFSFPFFMNFDFETEIKILPGFANYQPHSQPLPEKIVVGHHLLGQLYRDFPYIKHKIDQGDWKVPFEIPKHNLFEN